MISRALAAFLICLTVAPFTAPFPTCDVTALLADRPVDVAHGGSSHSGTLDDRSLSHALPSLNLSSRARLAAISERKLGADRLEVPPLPVAERAPSPRAASPGTAPGVLRI